MIAKLWFKAGLLLAAVALVVAVVMSYNSAIKKAERLAGENAELIDAVKNAQAASAEQAALRKQADEMFAKKSQETEVIYETEIQTVEVIKTVQGDCLAVAAPAAILDRLRN